MHFKREKDRIPNCEKCPKDRVALLKENYLAFSLFDEYFSVIADGAGNININMINEIVSMYDLDTEEKLITIKLILTCFQTAIERRGAKTYGKKWYSSNDL